MQAGSEQSVVGSSVYNCAWVVQNLKQGIGPLFSKIGQGWDAQDWLRRWRACETSLGVAHN